MKGTPDRTSSYGTGEEWVGWERNCGGLANRLGDRYIRSRGRLYGTAWHQGGTYGRDHKSMVPNLKLPLIRKIDQGRTINTRYLSRTIIGTFEDVGESKWLKSCYIRAVPQRQLMPEVPDAYVLLQPQDTLGLQDDTQKRLTPCAVKLLPYSKKHKYSRIYLAVTKKNVN